MWGMSFRLTALMLVIAGCSSSGTPATVPPSTPATASTVAVTTTAPPTTTTTHATTTTVDRLAEIEAVFQDLEERRLQALYEGDEETFKSLFANKEYMQRSLGAFDAVEFKAEWQTPAVAVIEVLHDDPGCIAVRTATNFSGVFVGGSTEEVIEVVESIGSGWGMSYAGEGWACEGPHPFSP
jgi:hypothetical protein